MSIVRTVRPGITEKVSAAIDRVGRASVGITPANAAREARCRPAPTAGEDGMVSKFGGVAPRSTKRGSVFKESASSPLVVCQFEKFV